MMHMPMKSVYNDLDSSVTSVSGLLDSVINICNGYKDVFIPTKRDQQTAEQYTAFTTWLLGRLFYLMSSSALSSKLNLCAAAQISILQLLERHRCSVFISIIDEYLNCLSGEFDVELCA
ncbi:hypothetical protein L798_08300 [Zootermopsis nevadensis]|uniref:Uncharacterized protein n=1 Tax=Zootermopsis nevadensis TaxID=136037 RepID=A0A067RE89_ZOONE|nr:hypothetical protein L798_08300 [Zootermopsis nevadensis]